MMRKKLAAVLLVGALAITSLTSCSSTTTKTTEAPQTETIVDTEAATTEAATTEAVTTEAPAETETESAEVISEESETESASVEEISETETEMLSETAENVEALTEEETTEAATTEEETTEAATTEEETTEAVTATEEETTEAATETEEETTEAAATEEETTEAATETEAETTEAATETEEETTEAATETEEETTEAATETETGTEDGGRLDDILEAGKIVVCTSPDYAPYEFEDPSKDGQDKYVGADMELARYIADKLGVELEISAMDFDACLAAIGAGRVDLGLIGMVPKDERLTLMDFTDVYYNDGEQYIVIMKDREDELSTLAAFDGLKVAAQNGTLQQTLVEEQTNADMELISKVTDGILMLKSGKVDGIAVASVVANNLLENNEDLAIAGEAFEYTSLGVVGGVPKGETALVEKLNEIIEEVIDEGLFYEWIDEANELAAEM